MPISPSASTGLKGSIDGAVLIDSGSAGASATLTVGGTGHLVTCVTAAYRESGVMTEVDLISGVTCGGAAMTLAKRKKYLAGNYAVTEVCIWYIHNQTSGDKTIALDFAYEDDNTCCNWHADSWPITLSSGALDVTSDASYATNTATVSVPSSGTTGTLAQSSELILVATANRWNYGYAAAPNTPVYGDSNTATAPATGYTYLCGQNQDSANRVTFQSSYKEVSVTSGVSASWSQIDQGDNGTAAALATFKINTVSRRIRVLADTAINGDSGITAYAWSGTPDQVLAATPWTNITAESSGGIVFLNNPPAAWTTGATVNVILHQPNSPKQTTGWVVGKVEEY